METISNLAPDPEKNKLEKERRWEEMSNEIKEAVDGLGKSIDKNVLDLIIAINLSGINTTQSCEGHIDERFIAPYVDIESKKSPELEDAEEKETDEAKQMEIADRIMLENKKEYIKIFGLLDEFYEEAEEEKRKISTENRLIIRQYGRGIGRLESQGAQSAYIFSEGERVEKIKAYQEEMAKFSKFLKDRFFS